MPLYERAYLADILKSCEAIKSAILGLDLHSFQGTRLIRSAVEREFIMIGKAMAALGRVAPSIFAAIPQARRVVDFRNFIDPRL